jgi:hypothetical protein
MRLKLMAAFLAVAALFVCGSASSEAKVLQIQYTGVDLTYNGSVLFDTKSILGGGGVAAFATPLTSEVYLIDGVPVGGFLSGIFLDVFLGLGPIAAPAPFTSVTVSGFGISDLLTPPASTWGLAVDVLMNVTITNLGGGNLFLTAVGEGSIFAQALPGFVPFALSNPISVSLSTQIMKGTYKTAGGFITGFRARGTGEHSGTLVPEPSSCILLGVGVLFGTIAYRRRKVA